MNRSNRQSLVAAVLIAGACAACHGERPDVVASPPDAGVPGLLPVKNAPPPTRLDLPLGPDAGPPNAAVAEEPTAEAPVAPRHPEADISPAALAAAVTANNRFALALFALLRAGNAKSNLLTSPLSAELALTMAYAGATGQTRAEMARALSFGSAPAQTIFDGQNALSQALERRGASALALAAHSSFGSARPPVAKDYQLDVVNSLWGEATYPWQPAFLRILAADYGAPLYRRDFIHQAEPARQAINAWVSKKTADKINDLLPAGAVGGETRLVLVNALHLKLPWQTPFRPAATVPAVFTRVDRTQLTTPFMNSQASLPYLDDGAAQVAALPMYGNELYLVIALPHAGTSLDAYERSLRSGAAALRLPKKNALLALSLPKSAFTSPSFSLRSALQALGMKQAFDDEQAHFEGMGAPAAGTPRLFVSDVLQKAMIDVQETGLEAAAATAVVMRTAMALIPSGPARVPIPMIVNRPYLLAVLDAPTGAILILGHINDPAPAASPRVQP
ncbi:MAG: serpin family protein [Pseudomonadota bacterium]